MTLNNTINAVYQEQQTFVPTISGTTSSGVGTYTSQIGFWSRIGNLIFIQLSVTWTAHTGTGDMLVSNLPFSCRNTSGFDPEFILNIQNIMLPATTASIFGHSITGTNDISLNTIRSAGTTVTIAMSASGTVHTTGWYLK